MPQVAKVSAINPRKIWITRLYLATRSNIGNYTATWRSGRPRVRCPAPDHTGPSRRRLHRPVQSRHALWVESGLRVGRQVEILSSKFVEKQERPGYYFDGAGLYLQVSPTKSKSWILRYTRFQKTREMGLGSLQAVSLAEARDTARQYRKLLTEGKDPIEVRDAKRQRRGSRVPPRSALPGAI